MGLLLGVLERGRRPLGDATSVEGARDYTEK
jgi:hypothetical protein